MINNEFNYRVNSCQLSFKKAKKIKQPEQKPTIPHMKV